LLDEVEMPPGAAELAVGDAAIADILLQLDHLADAIVLDRAQAGGIERAARMGVAGIEQARRTQEAADMVGAEGRRHALGYHALGHGRAPAIVARSNGDRSRRAAQRLAGMLTCGPTPLLQSKAARSPRDISSEQRVAGLYFEEFVVGQVIEHAIRRTVTEADNTLFSVMTMNPQPLHLDAEFAAASEFGQRLVNSLFTLGLMIGLSVGDTTIGTTIANLGMTDVRFPKPVFHGDTLHAVTRVLAVRDSKSRADAGLVEFEHSAINQRGEIVAICKRTALMKRGRPAS